MLAHLIRPTNRIESVGQISIVAASGTYCRMRCLRILSGHKSHRTVGRIRRLRRIRQIVIALTSSPLQPLYYPRRGYCIPHAVVVSVIQIALYFVVIISLPVLPANGRLEITASAHGLPC